MSVPSRLSRRAQKHLEMRKVLICLICCNFDRGEEGGVIRPATSSPKTTIKSKSVYPFITLYKLSSDKDERACFSFSPCTGDRRESARRRGVAEPYTPQPVSQVSETSIVCATPHALPGMVYRYKLRLSIRTSMKQHHSDGRR